MADYLHAHCCVHTTHRAGRQWVPGLTQGTGRLRAGERSECGKLSAHGCPELARLEAGNPGRTGMPLDIRELHASSSMG